MTDHHHDDDAEFELGRQLKMKENLYNAAIASPISLLGGDFLYRAQLLLRIADDDLDAAKEVIHQPAGRDAAVAEFANLTEEERKEMGERVGWDWALCVKAAVDRLFHAARVLGVDVNTLDADHIALTAATMLGKPSPFEPEGEEVK
jgi:hypothetical protein